MIRHRGCCFTACLVMLHAVGCVLAAPIGAQLDLSDRYVTFDVAIERTADELEIEVLQELQPQNGWAVVRMQLLQLNLMKLLVGLDIFILICVYFYGKDSSQHQIQIIR